MKKFLLHSSLTSYDVEKRKTQIDKPIKKTFKRLHNMQLVLKKCCSYTDNKFELLTGIIFALVYMRLVYLDRKREIKQQKKECSLQSTKK